MKMLKELSDVWSIALFSLHYTVYMLFHMQGAQLRRHIDATLGSGNLREAVRLPPGEDPNEWLAVNSNILPLVCQV